MKTPENSPLTLARDHKPTHPERMGPRLLAFALVFTACLAPQSTQPAPSWAGPVPAPVLIADSVGPCHVAAVYAAAEWIRRMAGHDVFVVSVVQRDDPRVVTYAAGYVIVTTDPLSRPDAFAEAHRIVTPGGWLVMSADVRLGQCSVQATAHELLHVLGLRHAEAGVMGAVHDEGAWGITGDELRQIARD